MQKVAFFSVKLSIITSLLHICKTSTWHSVVQKSWLKSWLKSKSKSKSIKSEFQSQSQSQYFWISKVKVKVKVTFSKAQSQSQSHGNFQKVNKSQSHSDLQSQPHVCSAYTWSLANESHGRPVDVSSVYQRECWGHFPKDSKTYWLRGPQWQYL